jgi:hypothetical protein
MPIHASLHQNGENMMASIGNCVHSEGLPFSIDKLAFHEMIHEAYFAPAKYTAYQTARVLVTIYWTSLTQHIFHRIFKSTMMVLRYKEFVCMVILPLLNGSLFSTYWWHW